MTRYVCQFDEVFLIDRFSSVFAEKEFYLEFSFGSVRCPAESGFRDGNKLNRTAELNSASMFFGERSGGLYD